MNRLAAQALRWSFVLCILVYLPMWGAAMRFVWGDYAGRMREGAGTNQVLLAVRELTPLLIIALAVAANPNLLRQRVAGPVSWCLAVLFGGAVVFVCRNPELPILKCGVILGRFSVFFLVPLAVRSIFQRCSARCARSIATTLVGILLLNVIICFAQTRAMRPYEGSTSFGARTIGMTNNPNTAGSMLALAPLLVFVRAAGRPGMMLGFACLSFVGALTTGSRAAMGGMAILLVLVVSRTYPRARIPLLVMGLVLVAYIGASLSRLSGRYEQIRNRPENPRLAIARNAIAQASLPEALIGRGIGVGSNSFVTLFGVRHELSIVADSLMTSWFIQFGLLGLLVLYTNTYHLFRCMGPDGIMLFAFFMLFSATQNLIEVYPTNYLLMTIAGMYGARQREGAHG